MKRLMLAAVAALFAVPALAADLGGPKKINAVGAVVSDKASFAGCYGEVAGGGLAIEVGPLAEVMSNYGLGLGCNVERGRLVFGGFARHMWAEGDTRLLTLGARAGVKLNESLLAYGLLAMTTDGKSPKFGDSIISLGAGLETHIISERFSIFIEGAKDIAAQGAAKDISDAWTVTLGGRFKFLAY